MISKFCAKFFSNNRTIFSHSRSEQFWKQNTIQIHYTRYYRPPTSPMLSSSSRRRSSSVQSRFTASTSYPIFDFRFFTKLEYQIENATFFFVIKIIYGLDFFFLNSIILLLLLYFLLFLIPKIWIL